MIISKEHKDALVEENKKRLKKAMTDLAAGHISKKDADMLIKGLKETQIKPEQESEGEHTHKRKKAIKAGGNK